MSCSIARAWASTSGEVSSCVGALAQHVIRRIAPAQAALGHLVQRRRALGRELAEDLPGFPAGLQAVLGTPAGHPAGDGDRGDRADPLEAGFDHLGVVNLTRFCRARDGESDHVRAARVQCLAEAADVVYGSLDSSPSHRRLPGLTFCEACGWHGYLTPPIQTLISGDNVGAQRAILENGTIV